MAKPIAAYKGGIHSLIEFAVRADGQAFRRFQSKGPRGYFWSGWAAYIKLDPNNLPESMSAGFSDCYPAGQYSNWKNWRLPNS